MYACMVIHKHIHRECAQKLQRQENRKSVKIEFFSPPSKWFSFSSKTFNSNTAEIDDQNQEKVVLLNLAEA